MRRRAGVMLPLLLTLSVACRDRDPAADAASATALEDVAAPEWAFAAEPALQIGTAEGEAPYQLHRVRGAAHLSNGNVVVLDGGSSELRIFDAAGRFITKTGGRGDGPGEFRQPWAMYLRGDTIHVIDPGAERLSSHAPDGTFLRSRPYDRNRHMGDGWLYDNSVIVGAAYGPARERVRAAVARLPRPDSTWFFREVRTAGDDQLWVRVRPSDAAAEWLVFDYDAQPLGRVRIPEAFTLYDARSDHVLGVWQDSLDVQSVRALRFDRPPLNASATSARAAPAAVRPPDETYEPMRGALRNLSLYQEYYYARRDGGYVYAGTLDELRTFDVPPAVRQNPLTVPAGVVLRILDGGRFGWFAVAADTASGAMCASGQGFMMPQSWGSGALACF